MPYGRCPPKFSAAQREALTRRMLRDDVSIAQAVRDAAAGELADVAAFNVPESTAQHWVADARESEPAALPDAEALEDVRRRLWAIQLASLDKLKKLQRKADPTYEDTRILHFEFLACVKRHDALGG